jgi:hypothetical protein
MRRANYVAAVAPDTLTAAAMMVTLSAAPGMRSVLSSIPLEDTNSLLALSLLLPPRKTHRTSHQRQIVHLNAQKGKEVYAQALMRAMILVVVAREKENHGPMWSILKQVERKFAVQGHPVPFNTETVNRYVQNDMVGCAPLLRGYKGIIPKAAFDLFVLAVLLNRSSTKMNMEKKARMAYHAKKDATELVLVCPEHELDNDVNMLCGKDLATLLCWKGIVGKLPNIANKHTMYLELLTKGGEENEGSIIIPALWMEANKAELKRLKNAPIKMGDTAYAHHEMQMTRDAKTACKKMSAAKREAFLREIDKDAGKENKPFPPNNIEAE